MKENEHGEINLEFINTISAFPIELKDKLSISKEKDKDKDKYKYQFDNLSDNKLEYTIVETISDGVTGSNAIILKLEKIVEQDATVIENDKPEKLVLKLMPINKEEYYNYTPLTFQHIIPDSQKSNIIMNPRYYQYSKKIYDNLELDKDYNGHNVNESDEKIFITAAELDDFKNEMIQNIICRHILDKNNENLINYYNYIYIKVNGKDYGGILMESLAGSLNQYLDNLKENNQNIFENDDFANSLNKYLTNLDILKLPQYRFNHSDLKVQNVFYKIGKDNKLILKIADLDKSSITFNGIRFINGNFINKNIDFNKSILSNLNKEDNFLTIKEDFLRTSANIEFEQIFLRYSFFPPPPFLDMLMLFITLRVYYYDNELQFTGYFNDQRNFRNIFNKYIGGDYDIVESTNAIGDQLQTVQRTSDFGEILLQTLIVNKIKIPLSYNNIYKGDTYNNNKIKLTDNYKLIVYGPSEFKLHTSMQKKIFLFFTKKSHSWETEKGYIKIFYTGNSEPKKDQEYYKTNRYTKMLGTLLYEYE